VVPVFIGGCDRSGTTFLGSLLGAHSECLTIPEAQFKIRLLRHLDPAAPFDARAMLGHIVSHWRFKIWGLDIDTAVPQAELGQSYQELLEWLVRQYGQRQGKPNPGWWIDHTPANLRHGLRLRAAFPNAKFIHIVRDGRGVAASVLPLDWGPNSIQGAARWWSEGLAPGLAAESTLPQAHILRVRYEDLVLETEATLRRLCAYCGLEYQPDMAGGGGFRVSEYSSGQHTLVGQAPDRRRLDAWERELTPRQIEIFEYMTGDLLAYLDYPLRYGAQARAGTRREALLATWQEWAGRYSNRWRYRQRVRQIAN
jgi:Sulfotransferase family